jgi:hypothetical protein
VIELARRLLDIASMRLKLCAPAMLTLFLAWTGSASAAPVLCPGTPGTGDREFMVDTTPSATCLAYALGNISGNGDAVNDLGLVTLDKSDDGTDGLLQGALSITGAGSTSGTFTISPLAWASYSQLVIAFKAGDGQLDPDWAAFLLLPNASFGTWSISGQQSLSHANLYGGELLGTPRGVPEIPEPTSMLLLGSGLAALAAHRRRRRSQPS